MLELLLSMLLHRVWLLHWTPLTRGMERFSARKNFSKILQVSHFHLGFSPGKNNNEIIYSHRVLLEILDPDIENTNETMRSVNFVTLFIH